MKIITREKEPNDYGEGERFELDIVTDEGKKSFSAGRGEPEDNYLGRDLNFVYSIPEMLKMAYEAGKRGEILEESTEPYDE